MSTRQWTAQERDADQGDGLYARLLAAALHRLGSDNSVQPPAEAMPQDWVQLDWPQLCDAIAERCVSDEAAGLAKEHPLFEQPDCLRLHQNLILESACLIEKGDRPDLLHVPALSTVLARASRDAVLSAEQLGLVCEALEASNRLRRFFDHRREEAPLAWELAEPMQRLDEVERRLRRAFGPDGRLSDDASPELGHLRRRVLRLHEQMRSRLEEKLKSRDMEDLLQDSFYTQREGRYVLPIRVHARTQLEGIVHASSGSGQTVFMEPREFIEINNQIRLSEIEVEEEEERILRNLTEVVGSIAGALAHNLRRLFYLDLVQAGAQLALDLRSNAPHIAARIELGRARHPLLQLRLGAQGRDVVPNQIALPVESRALVISGANAGGKTVTLKTIGLFALLLRAGQPLPAAPGSEFPLFNEVFADIGDEQSIVQDTSTFSAHVIKLRQILPRVGPGSLVLLDEPFAGTDPAQGGALTMALLERLYIAGATVVVTTHLDRVKAFALEYPWLCNASVEFDLNAMRPSYRLRIGTPGGSAALAIAARLGMPAELLSRAEQLHREEAKSGLENALGKLENERVALEDERKLLATSRSQMQARSEQLAGEIEKVKRRELQVLSSDSVELRRRLRELRKRIREFEARIAEAKLEKAAEAKALERELRPLEQEARETHAVIRQSHGSKLVPLPKEAVRQGLGVMSRRYEREATIVEVFAEHVLLQLGALKVQVPYDDLAVSPNAAKERSDAKPAKATPRPSSSRQQSTAAAPPAPPIVIPHPENTIDLRGMNRDEAIERVEFFLDSALRKELSGICVIHGHGTGVLKAAVRSFLPKSPYVSSCWPGSREEGGDGVTLARLRDR